MRCSLCNYQHGGSATNKQKLDPQSTQCASPPVVVVDINFHLCARCRLAAIEAIIKSERGTIYGCTTGVFVVCAQIHAASERGCWKNQAPHAEHTESGGSTREKAESHNNARRELFHLCKCRPCLFCETRRTIHRPSNVIIRTKQRMYVRESELCSFVCLCCF
jgi:hypothetical protein